MEFYSTNQSSPQVSLIEALFTGQAPDKGLYMPKSIPVIDLEEMKLLQRKSYPYLAYRILSKYISDDMLDSNILRKLCEDAYNYDIPIEHVENNSYVLRLDQGPTASFKDFAARMMARLFGTFMKNRKDNLVILTATSGDTGSAIAHAFHNIQNTQVMVLFPPLEVSNRQRKQMTTLGDNIITVGVDGKFDDCQALVKKAFSDKGLKILNLTSANSINIGRLLPQIIYYFYAYLQTTDIGDKIVFSVPSGNFGNMMGALLAMRMGLPVEHLIISTNSNNEVPLYLKTGNYIKISPSKVCISNAMNVGHPSNFARVIDLYGGKMDENGIIHQEPDIDIMRKELWTISIDDNKTRQTIKSSWEKHKLLLEPHGAVAWAGLNHYLSKKQFNGPAVSVETAHPAKFPEAIEDLLDISPKIPPSLADLDTLKEKYLSIPNDYNYFRNLLQEKYTA